MNKRKERRWFELFVWRFGIKIYSLGSKGKKANAKAQPEDLLRDVRKVIEKNTELRSLFGTSGVRIRSIDLLRMLKQLPGGKWTKLTAVKMAIQLKPFGIRPQNMRIAGKVSKGYLIENTRP